VKEGFVVPVREKVAFGLGDMANNLSYTALQFYLVFFLVTVAGLPAAWAGVIYFVARASNAIADFTVGVISDRARSRFGRRRVFLLAGAVPLGIAFALLWQVPGMSGAALVAYYLVITVAFNIVFSLVSIPYNALMPEMTQSYDERTQLSGYRIVLSFVGNLLAAAGVALIVDSLYGGTAEYATSYPVMGLVFGAVTTVLVLITFAGTRERVAGEAAAVPGGITGAIRSLWRVREMRLAIGLFIANQIAADLFMTIVIFYIKDVMAVDADLTFVIMAIPLVVAVVSAPLWVVVGERAGKRRAYLIAGTYFILPLLALLVAPAGQLWLLVVIAVFAGVGMSATQVLPWSILPDVVEVDEYENGVRREGMFFGTTLFLYKVCSAVAVGAGTAMLGALGYVEGGEAAAQPGSAVLGVRLLAGIGPAVFMVLAMLCARAMPLTRERFEEIKALIEARRAAGDGPGSIGEHP
jgi:glycoside/pentoside/hexuronide:cation symporter, GPH family